MVAYSQNFDYFVYFNQKGKYINKVSTKSQFYKQIIVSRIYKKIIILTTDNCVYYAS
jgi:hypothetical protein